MRKERTKSSRSLRMPSKAEVYGVPPESSELPLIIEAVAHSEDEENNSVELMMQTSSSTELGYEGLAIQELIGSMAYNSAFNQLRTKEQLGYIVSAFVKKSNGGGKVDACGGLNNFARNLKRCRMNDLQQKQRL